MRTIKNLLLVLSTGYIFVYFSEHLFWARVRPGDTIGGWIGVWFAYSLLAYVFLTLLAYFRIKTIWALFLAGSVVGWLAEGIIVQTAYEFLPLSLSFTGLAWHALITVWIGWYVILRSQVPGDYFITLKLAAAIGGCSGLWAISWWLEPDGGVASLTEYGTFVIITSTLVILAYQTVHWSLTEEFSPPRWMTLLVTGLFAVYFLLVSLPAAPVSIIVLPVLLALVFTGLRQNRKFAEEGSLLTMLKGNVPSWKVWGFLVLPATSILVYGLALRWNLHWHTNWILYLIATPVGFILFGISLYNTLWKNQPLDTSSILQIITPNIRANKGDDGGKYVSENRQGRQSTD